MEKKKLLEDWLNTYKSQHGISLNTSSSAHNTGLMGMRYGLLNIVIEIDSKNFVYFHVRLMSLPSIDQLSFFQQLLSLNLSCLQAKGSTLALDPTQSFVLLCLRQTLEFLDEQSFGSLLSAFALHAEKLYELLTRQVNEEISSEIRVKKIETENQRSFFSNQRTRV